MSPDRSAGHSDLAKIVEKQMRNWELARAQHIASNDDDESPCEQVATFVAFSRGVASGGSDVAQRLGERLNWPVFDREILQAMAGDDQVRTRLYEHLDERDMSWLEKSLRWIIGGEFNKDDYYHRLNESVLAIARKGHAVFLGRGVDRILPCERGLRVRIHASLKTCAAELARRRNISEALATAEVERIDRERAEFRRNHFGKDANRPEQYDLCITTDRFSTEQAVELIVAAMTLRNLLNP